MIAFVLLAAGIETILFIAIAAIIFVIRIVNHLASMAQGAGPKANRPPQRLQPRPQPGGNVQSQIDEFLRRAAQRQEPKRAAPPVTGFPPATVVTPEVVEDEPVGGRVVRQVKQYIDTSEFQRRSSHMGEEVSQADEQFGQHLKQAFSGDVSKLAKRPGEAAAAAQTQEEDTEVSASARPTLDAIAQPGEGLASLLGDSNDIVRAIILSEILQRREI